MSFLTLILLMPFLNDLNLNPELSQKKKKNPELRFRMFGKRAH
jgi:hypothetical protein